MTKVLNRKSSLLSIRLGMKCNLCDGNLITLYVSDKDTKVKKSIGKICINCDNTHEPTEYFLELKKQREKKKHEEEQMQVKAHDRPKFSITKFKEFCGNCGAKQGIKIRKNKEKLHIYFDEGQNELKVARNNPCIDYECGKCGNKWSEGLPMPNKPKYSIPPKMTKEKLRLAFLRVGSQNITIPKNLNKIGMEIHRELEQERNAKEAREIEERLKRKS